MYAIIQNGIVKSISQTDLTGKIQADLLIIECDETIKVGQYYKDGSFYDYNPELDLDGYKDIYRLIRNELLEKSDKYMFSDYPKGEITEQQILDYRQELRDIINNITELGQEIEWPTNPFL